ncbi:MAG: LacI family DNA-binding transcriptional regulator [Bacillota bacterium]
MARRRKTITLQDLSDRLGISPFTISKALSGRPGMSEETRAHIIETAREMGYTWRSKPEQEGRRTLAVVMPSRYVSEFFYFADLLQGAEAAAREANCVLTIVGITPDQMSASLPEQVRDVDGAIYLPMLEPQFLQRAIDEGPPAVLINFPRRSWRVDSVVWDAEAGMGLCVDHLVAQGHRRIGYVGTPDVAPGYRLRWVGFREAMREHGLEPKPNQPLIPTAWPPEAVLQSVRELIGSMELLPDALVCDFETTALAVARVLNDLGRRDVAVACADQLSPSSQLSASIPHLYYHRDHAGRRAVEQVLWRIANADEPYHHIRIAVDLRPK